jgi:hypothetical protein
MASAGHTSSHAEHDTQSRGRGSHGRDPCTARQSVGHTAAQSPHPVHRVASRIGNPSD